MEFQGPTHSTASEQFTLHAAAADCWEMLHRSVHFRLQVCLSVMWSQPGESGRRHWARLAEAIGCAYIDRGPLRPSRHHPNALNKAANHRSRWRRRRRRRRHTVAPASVDKPEKVITQNDSQPKQKCQGRCVLSVVVHQCRQKKKHTHKVWHLRVRNPVIRACLVYIVSVANDCYQQGRFSHVQTR